MLDEPRSGRLAAWGNALLAGLVSPDDAAQRIVGRTRCTGSRGCRARPGPVGLTLALGRLRALGVTGLRVALPVPGHPLGLSGPPEFNARALDGRGGGARRGRPALGLVPEVYEAGPAGDVHVEVVWRCLPVREAPPADVPSLGEAERELAEALRDATEALSRLDVAGVGPGGAGGAGGVPGAGGARAARCWRRGIRRGRCGCWSWRSGWARCWCRDGARRRSTAAAVSASEIAARAEALRPVERTARRAQVAAYNAYVEERERGGL